MSNPIVEIIACDVDDAMAAAAGGADRIELITRFDLGGLTPPLDLIRAVLAAVHIPVRVMLRESEDFVVKDPAERKRLCALANAFSKLPMDGLVCGFLRRDGDQVEIDHELLSAVLAAAPGLPCTFHRAFEELPDPMAAITALSQYPQITHILTSGAPGNDDMRIERLRQCHAAAHPRLTILAGGGLEADFLDRLRHETTLTEFHLGKLAREPMAITGTVSADRVRAITEHMGKHAKTR
ncbi:MAG: copper homeostasis protein CutC [Blastocatellia bacterium]